MTVAPQALGTVRLKAVQVMGLRLAMGAVLTARAAAAAGVVAGAVTEGKRQHRTPQPKECALSGLMGGPPARLAGLMENPRTHPLLLNL